MVGKKIYSVIHGKMSERHHKLFTTLIYFFNLKFVIILATKKVKLQTHMHSSAFNEVI